MNTVHTYGIAVVMILFSIACESENDTTKSVKTNKTIQTTTDLIIGLEDQPAEHQLGDPIAVRTDSLNNIYIADRASKIIKVFDSEGNYLRSLGGRGRGPGEFQDMEFMELTPEGHLVLMERGNLLYTIISTQGESIQSFPYNMSEQFYPSSIAFVNDQLLALFLDHNPYSEIPGFDRHLFYVYSSDFQDLFYSFFPFSNLDMDERYVWKKMIYNPGSFSLNSDKDLFIFSSAVYTGKLYQLKKNGFGRWVYSETITGLEPASVPYEIFSTESEFKASSNLPGALSIYGEEISYGRLLSLDLGIFYFDDGRIVHFFGERRENEDFGPESDYHFIDVHVQIFNEDGELDSYKELFSIEQHQGTILMSTPVNWKDQDDNFYLIDRMEHVPLIRRFTLEIED